MLKTLQHWQKDSDLATLRDPAALGKLPADEQAACKKPNGPSVPFDRASDKQAQGSS